MNRNCRRKTEKVYVKVNSDFDATGYMQPRQITWGDGRTYPIEQVRDFRPANTIADMPGDCYTVMVKAPAIKQIRGSLQLFRNGQVSSPYADHLESPVTSEK